ncbi:MAG: hypothetical protein KGD60_12660 [Candidatus Thorarchaeota archaeon]|nr:hypothetical protein [Candidatus Thorarchaeota archaeon]
MTHRDLSYWLLENGGPIIRFRTLVDIFDEQDVGVVSRALKEMVESPEVVKWLGRIEPSLVFNDVHSGRQNAFENVVGKLVQLGWRAGLQPFDSKTLPFRVWLSENVNKEPEAAHEVFKRTLIASVLARAGYQTVEAVQKQILSRLNTVHEFVKDPDFAQVYVDKSEYRGIPKGLESHELVNPQLYPEQQFALPWIHDVIAFSHLDIVLAEKESREKAEKILGMVLTPEYQNLPWSYGVAKYGKRYYVLGWAVHLPGYSKPPEGRMFAEMLVVLDVLAPFACVRKSPWFLNSMKYLEEFRTDDGTYSFPRAWLPEKKRGYWVGGEYMAFDERKGRKNAIEVESTFRMVNIKKRTGLF